MDDDTAIASWRRRIDDLDRRLLDLLNERSRCAQAIGAIKKRLGRAIFDPDREAAIVARALECNTGPLSDEAVRRVFERILDESRRMERLADLSGAEPPATGETERG